jgi:hypothetical protein
MRASFELGFDDAVGHDHAAVIQRGAGHGLLQNVVSKYCRFNNIGKACNSHESILKKVK